MELLDVIIRRKGFTSGYLDNPTNDGAKSLTIRGNTKEGISVLGDWGDQSKDLI